MTNPNKAYLFALITVLFWSTVATAFKITLAHLDIYQLVFYASLFSAFVLLVPVIIQGQLSLFLAVGKRYWRRSLLVAMLNPLLYYLVLFAAYDLLPAQIAQPINYTWAIVLTFMSVIFLGQKPIATDYIAAFICYLGVVLIASQGGSIDIDSSQIYGLSLAILSTVIWASYWVLNVSDPRDQKVAMALNFTLALPISGIICLLMSDLVVPLEGIYGAAYIGVFEMGLAFLFWSKALRMAENTSRVSNFIFLSPFLSLVFIEKFLGEAILPSTYAGLAVIITGLVIQRVGLSRQKQIH